VATSLGLMASMVALGAAASISALGAKLSLAASSLVTATVPLESFFEQAESRIKMQSTTRFIAPLECR
jgi:hypothetical protein